MSTTTKTPNRLINEKSPYLLQHAHNPVDWYPWGEEAFAKAKAEDKPIFLSIGYSTCHWCHVMEKESFEDEEVARVLNNGFVPIKVDREERPDVDHIYMSVCQAMTGQGGWPLTVLMTPEKKPFFAGTYFPKHEKWGRPGLMEILAQVGEKWKEDRDLLVQAGDQVTEAIQPRPEDLSADKLTAKTLQSAFMQARRLFDGRYGGFGPAPKFPTPHNLFFLLRYWKRNNDPEALAMVEKTLESMYRGGIYDHIGYGFARYSTDEKWLVPHFEKMLYDNALLALAYIEGFQVTGRNLYARVAKEIFTYILRDMTSPEGGFYSAEDADSEGEEGKFYVWTPAEIKGILGERDGEHYCRLFDITPEGNFEGRSIPNLISAPPFDAAGEVGLEPGESTDSIELQRKKLFDARARRVYPYKDDKILTSWNGLMIAALARGAAVFDDVVYGEAAARATEFIFQRMRREDGRLLARYRDGESAYPAYLDDYAFFTWGLLELYQATFEFSYLERALDLAGQMIKLFWDKENGGFFFTGMDAEQLISRPKEIYDGAMPSGNSAALHTLLRLARLTGNTDLAETAEKQITVFACRVGQYPWGYTHFLSGLDFMLGPSREIVIAGEAGDADTEAMFSAIRRFFLPETAVVFHPPGDAGKKIEKAAPFVKEQLPVNGRTTAYVCRNYACRAPVTDLEGLIELLET